MCGIAGYVGKKEGLPIVLSCLQRLEYRGYDSAGALFFQKDSPRLIKTPGKLEILSKQLSQEKSQPSLAAIGHTRWATHGLPNKINAHPHHDCRKEVFLVHNGIIENYNELKSKLLAQGHRFISQTDTEVIAHLLEENLKRNEDFSEALKKSLKQITGAYALAIVNKKEPEKIYFARLGSPLIVGINPDEYFLASDPTALAGLVKKIIYLKDGQSGWFSAAELRLFPTESKIENLDITPDQAKKGNFPHFMLKEIFEEPDAVSAALRGRLFPKKNLVKLGGLESVSSKLNKIRKIEMIACGTSYHAGLIGAMLMEELAGLPGHSLQASEYRYRQSTNSPQTASLFISQSGETADTLAALRKANQQKYLTLGLVNAVGSSIARETKAGVYNHAGP